LFVLIRPRPQHPYVLLHSTFAARRRTTTPPLDPAASGDFAGMTFPGSIQSSIFHARSFFDTDTTKISERRMGEVKIKIQSEFFFVQEKTCRTKLKSCAYCLNDK
jgi:hypothetical protein